MKSISLIIFLLLAIDLNAQTVRGVVRDGITGKFIATVKVTNIHTDNTAYTDNDGIFAMKAQKGDVLHFSFLGYISQKHTVPAGIGTSQMEVVLFPNTYQLDEFVLRPNYTPYQIDSIERRQTYTRALARQKGGSIMSPVTFVAEKLSKRSKRLFQFQKDFVKWEEEKFIATRYTRELVHSQTGLQGDTLAFFMNAYPMPYDFARVASALELKIWIRENYKEWSAYRKKQEKSISDSHQN